jgi:hypothetical protein
MKLLDVISRLQELEKVYGDINICIFNEAGGYFDFDVITEDINEYSVETIAVLSLRAAVTTPRTEYYWVCPFCKKENREGMEIENYEICDSCSSEVRIV